MNPSELEELIRQAGERGGGLMLSVGGRPQAVVLTVERYNELLAVPQGAVASSEPAAEPPAQAGQSVLVTGGAGYIGAHAVRELLSAGHRPVVLDNLSTGLREHVPDGVPFVEGDVADEALLGEVFSTFSIDAVMHFAASIEVEESVREPVRYLENNALGTARLLSAMERSNVRRIVLSSTAAVYAPSEHPIAETDPTRPENPYGLSKLMAERLVHYYCRFSGFRGIVFRYFNAAGCDPKSGIASTHISHLMPIVLKVALGLNPSITVHGDDYATHDGTCVRDYVHVSDIARAHVLALGRLAQSPSENPGSTFELYNIGTGRGSSVREVVAAAAEVTGHMVPMEVGPRRQGDAPQLVADCRLAERELGFRATRSSLEGIVRDAWEALCR